MGFFRLILIPVSMNIKTKVLLQSAWLFALLVLQVDLRAALYLELPGGPGVTEITLQPSQSGQVVDISIRNDSASAVANVLGLNFGAQVGGGTSGPKITNVKLDATGSIFAAYGQNFQYVFDNSWRVFYNIDTGGGSVAIPTGTTLLAQLTFDTTGLSSSGPWPLVFNDNSVPWSVDFTLVDTSSLAIDNIVSGQIITAVPEPASFALATGLLLLSLGVVRRVKS
jgi:hypothetical protein